MMNTWLLWLVICIIISGIHHVTSQGESFSDDEVLRVCLFYLWHISS